MEKRALVMISIDFMTAFNDGYLVFVSEDVKRARGFNLMANNNETVDNKVKKIMNNSKLV